MRLYDELKSEHGLGARERLLLEVAALLHDIGNYVSLRSHHKHTQYILSVSEVFGLSREDMGIVSYVARYHRRALPERSHTGFMALDRDSRVVVNKLAAILRLANALDADHMQKIKDIKVRFEDGLFVIEIDGAGDMTIERLTAQSRCDLMSDVFGRRVSLQETGVRA
jgi:exopolyphosphatase/guanosine-5'-triphosphate,3'-diphosphate pyrophosphatase